MQVLSVKIGLSVLLITAACSPAMAEHDVSQYRVKLVGMTTTRRRSPALAGPSG